MTEPILGDVLVAGALEVLPGAYTARADGRVVALTPLELDVLVALMTRRDRVVLREELHQLCWDRAFDSTERNVDVYVRKLRRKLEQALPQWRFIHTHYRLGYRFSPTCCGTDADVCPGTAPDHEQGSLL